MGQLGKAHHYGGSVKEAGGGIKRKSQKRTPKNVSTQTQPQERVCYFFDLLKASLPHQSNQQNMPVQGKKRGRRGKERRGK